MTSPAMENYFLALFLVSPRMGPSGAREPRFTEPPEPPVSTPLLVTRSALQSWNWQVIGMSWSWEWRSWRHTTAPSSHNRPACCRSLLGVSARMSGLKPTFCSSHSLPFGVRCPFNSPNSNYRDRVRVKVRDSVRRIEIRRIEKEPKGPSRPSL